MQSAVNAISGELRKLARSSIATTFNQIDKLFRKFSDQVPPLSHSDSRPKQRLIDRIDF
jgi:hypothetical protein